MTNKTRRFFVVLYIYCDMFFFYFEYASLFVSMSLCIGLLIGVNAHCSMCAVSVCSLYQTRGTKIPPDGSHKWGVFNGPKHVIQRGTFQKIFLHCFNVIMLQSSGLKPLKRGFQCR